MRRLVPAQHSFPPQCEGRRSLPSTRPTGEDGHAPQHIQEEAEGGGFPVRLWVALVLPLLIYVVVVAVLILVVGELTRK